MLPTVDSCVSEGPPSVASLLSLRSFLRIDSLFRALGVSQGNSGGWNGSSVPSISLRGQGWLSQLYQSSSSQCLSAILLGSNM